MGLSSEHDNAKLKLNMGNGNGGNVNVGSTKFNCGKGSFSTNSHGFAFSSGLSNVTLALGVVAILFPQYISDPTPTPGMNPVGSRSGTGLRSATPIAPVGPNVKGIVA